MSAPVAPSTPQQDGSQLLVLSPSPAGVSTHRKRKITPSSELSTPKRPVILSPPGLASVGESAFTLSNTPFSASLARLFPTDRVTVDRKISVPTVHGHPDPLLPRKLESTHPRHVILPFNLRNNREAYSNEAGEVLERLFPDVKCLCFDGHFLRFCLKELPPKPWPVTIAGIPPYLTTDMDDDGPLPSIKRPAKSNIRVSQELDYRDYNGDLEDLFSLIQDFFANTSISATEIQYWIHFVIVVLEHRHADLTLVPRTVARCPVYYLFEDEMGRPASFPAHRLKQPMIDVVDNSNYSILRPGVLISSGQHPTDNVETLTTSGVLLRDNLGYNYMTVVSHGFPFGDSVFHPVAGGSEIGKMIMELTHTDVALVRLHQNVEFVNEIFENSVLEGMPPVRLQSLVQSRDIRTGSFISLDSPFTGFIEGTAGARAKLRIPSDDPHQPKQQWIQTRWDHLGQGFRQRMVGGVCGSAMCNDEGGVIGFFRYAPTEGEFQDWCMSVAVDHLIDRGYSIVH